MPRRGLTLALVALIALQLFGSMGFASVCLEPCADEQTEDSCAPVCSFCATCAHVQQAIVPTASPAGPRLIALRAAHPERRSDASLRAEDIFHVPLSA